MVIYLAHNLTANFKTLIHPAVKDLYFADNTAEAKRYFDVQNMILQHNKIPAKVIA